MSSEDEITAREEERLRNKENYIYKQFRRSITAMPASSHSGRPSFEELPETGSYKKRRRHRPPIIRHIPPKLKIREKVVQQKFICPVCQKHFSTKQRLDKHEFVHLESDEKTKIRMSWTHHCYFCQKRFKEVFSLYTHITIHTGETPYSCDQCGKGFKQSGALSAHKTLHINPNKFVCDPCKKTFANKRNFEVHHKKVHLKLKDIPCLYCGQMFVTKGDLAQHMKKDHLGIRYKCPYCSATVAHKASLGQHVKRYHPDEMPPPRKKRRLMSLVVSN